MSYQEILALRDNIDAVDKGYRFEQIIREIQPWDRKPPVATSLPSEQLDGVFLWKDQAYLIESKAKVDLITPGSHDWEDFELKIRRRKNAVIGLFCSLYPVNETIYIRAEELNKEGHFVMVLAGQFWDDIGDYQLPIKDLLAYMKLFGRIKFLAKPPQIKKIVDWCYDKESIQKKFEDLCRKNSSTFLRRHKSPFHSKLYISRDIDNQIESYSKEIKPSISNKAKDKPKQICLVRDYSGSGKTTLSLDIASNNSSYFGTGLTANEQDIDVKVTSFFSSLGDNFGLHELLSANKPIVFVVDSLDEANFDLNKKKKEVLAILKFIDELNKVAEKLNLAVYPVLFVFTIREDYWRDWESLFEGRKRNDINKRISTFASNEFPKALDNYSSCYSYSIVNDLSPDSKKVLSSPINLLIFSETYEYHGEIVVNEIWEGNVIDSYFTRKKDDIHKRYIQGFTSSVFFQLISLISFHIVKSKSNSITKNDIDAIIHENFIILSPYSDEIINAIVSELILTKDTENSNQLRFRHSRFIEFLLAFYIVYSIERDQNLKKLDYFAQVSFESGIVLMFRVHDDIRYIGKTKFPQILSQIEDYYSSSNYFMSKKLLRLRSLLSVNDKTEKEDLALILKNANSNDPQLIFDAYFVIVAKSNKQDQKTVLNLFTSAFRSCSNPLERYKLIVKLEYHKLLVNDVVLSSILLSNSAKDWEVYLGLILENNLGSDFQELWIQSESNSKFEQIVEQNFKEDWKQAVKLLKAIQKNLKITLGEP